GVRPAGPADGVPARGLRHVRGDEGEHPRRVRALHLQGRTGPPGRAVPAAAPARDDLTWGRAGGVGDAGEGRQDRTQRAVSVRLWAEVQEVPRRYRLRP